MRNFVVRFRIGNYLGTSCLVNDVPPSPNLHPRNPANHSRPGPDLTILRGKNPKYIFGRVGVCRTSAIGKRRLGRFLPFACYYVLLSKFGNSYLGLAGYCLKIVPPEVIAAASSIKPGTLPGSRFSTQFNFRCAVVTYYTIYWIQGLLLCQFTVQK